MTVTVLEADAIDTDADADATEAAEQVSAAVLASWPARAGAFAVDVFFPSPW